MYSYRVRTQNGERLADLSFRRHAMGWYARLMLDGEQFVGLGLVTGERRHGWTAIPERSSNELGVPRALTLVEGFRTRMDAATYLLKINGHLKDLS